MTWRGVWDIGVIVATAAAVSAGLIVWLKPLLVRYALARPNVRSSHKVPTPQGGGIAVVLATFAGVMMAAALSSIDRAALQEWWPLAGAATLLALVGAVDDIKTMPVAPRLVLQFLAVGTVVWLLPDEVRIVSFMPWWLERALAVVGGVYFVNLVNFMDGIDWMSVAEVVPLTGGVVLLGLLGAVPALAILTAAALAGAMAGFAPFNRPMAKLFLGDVGSLPIGLLLLWLLLQLASHGHLAAALLLPLYYLADATITLARRALAGERITQAHRSHYYQCALDRGWSVIAVVRRVFAVNLVLAALAAVTVLAGSTAVSMAMLALGLGAVAWLLFALATERR